VHAPLPSVLVVFEQLTPIAYGCCPSWTDTLSGQGFSTPYSTWYGSYTPDPPPTSVWRRIIFGNTSAPVSTACECLYRRYIAC
jgi:hypothetical protein